MGWCKVNVYQEIVHVLVMSPSHSMKNDTYWCTLPSHTQKNVVMHLHYFSVQWFEFMWLCSTGLNWKSLRTWIFCCASSVLMVSVVHSDSVNASSPGTQFVKMALARKVIVLVWLAPLSLLFHFFMLWQLYTLCNPCTHVARGRCSWWPPLSVSCHTWPYLRMKAHLWTCDRALWSSCHTWTGSVPPTCLPPQHRR